MSQEDKVPKRLSTNTGKNGKLEEQGNGI